VAQVSATFEASLFTQLKTGVTGVSNRVYAIIAPQTVTAPYLVYTPISPGRAYTHGGYSHTAARYQISCYAATAKAASDLADSVVSTLEGWNGVQAAFLDGRIAGHEADIGMYHVHVDYLLWHA
jgi:hypothetical protein